MVQKQTKLIALLATILMVGAIGALVFGWYQLQSKAAELDTTVTAVSTSLAQGVAIKELMTQLEETKTEREQLQGYVLNEADTVDFLATLETIAAEQGVEFETNSLDLTDSEAVKELSIGFSVSGIESNVLRFLRIMELVPYHASLDQLSLSRSTDIQTGSRKLSSSGSFTISVTNTP